MGGLTTLAIGARYGASIAKAAADIPQKAPAREPRSDFTTSRDVITANRSRYDKRSEEPLMSR